MPPPSGLLMIHEPAIYRLITQSHLPSADRFGDWVFEEVLPRYAAPARMASLRTTTVIRQELAEVKGGLTGLGSEVESAPFTIGAIWLLENRITYLCLILRIAAWLCCYRLKIDGIRPRAEMKMCL